MLNTKLRTAANNELEKDFFKFMNKFFGNTIEIIRNHRDMKLVASEEKYVKYVMKPNLKGGFPFSRELFPAQMTKTNQDKDD